MSTLDSKNNEAAVNDLTEGVIWKKLLYFAVPLLGSSLIQQLYNTVDIIFVGNFLGAEAAAAVGCSSLLITCLIGLFVGLSVGATVVTAQAFGAWDKQRLHRIVHTCGGITIFGGVLVSVLSLLLVDFFLEWLHVPEDIYHLAEDYVRVYFLSVTAIIAYNMGAGILRAMGDSRTPMLYQLVGGIANVFANYLFIVAWEMGVVGAAYATLISQSIAAGLVIFRMHYLDREYALRVHKIKFYKEELLQILKVGIPCGVQSMFMTLSNLIVQANINKLGTESIAAFTAYFKLENFIYYPLCAIGQAATTFVGQNFGAGKYSRIWQGVRTACLIGVSITVSLSLAFMFNYQMMYSIFLNEPDIIEIGGKICRVTFPFYFLYVFLETFSGAVRGMGKSFQPMLISLGCLSALRVVVLLAIMRMMPSAENVAWVYPITWSATALAHFAYYSREIRFWLRKEKAADSKAAAA